MNSRVPSLALFDYFQGLLRREDRLFRISPWGPHVVMEILHWHKVEATARELYLSQPSRRCPEFEEPFGRERIAQILREAVLQRQLEEIAASFESSGIEFLVLKGPLWGETSYPSTLWRHVGDIDLLVRPSARDAALARLTELHYRVETVGATIEDDLEKRGEVMLVSGEPGHGAGVRLPVELHWYPLAAPRFLRRLNVDVEDFFASAKPVLFRGRRFLRPRPEVQFGFHVVHGICQHQLKRLLPVVDMTYLLAESSTFDFSFVVDLMDKWKSQISFHLALRALAIFGPPNAAVAELGARAESVMPWISRWAADFLSPTRVLRSYEGKGYYLRKVLRVLASHPHTMSIGPRV